MTIDEAIALLNSARLDIGGAAELRLITQGRTAGEAEVLDGVCQRADKFTRRLTNVKEVFYFIEGAVAEEIETPDFCVDATQLLQVSA